jgi:hypothetical protein
MAAGPAYTVIGNIGIDQGLESSREETGDK